MEQGQQGRGPNTQSGLTAPYQASQRAMAVHLHDRDQVDDHVDHAEHGQPPGHCGQRTDGRHTPTRRPRDGPVVVLESATPVANERLLHRTARVTVESLRLLCGVGPGNGGVDAGESGNR